MSVSTVHSVMGVWVKGALIASATKEQEDLRGNHLPPLAVAFQWRRVCHKLGSSCPGLPDPAWNETGN